MKCNNEFFTGIHIFSIYFFNFAMALSKSGGLGPDNNGS
jgi:hypothetical protein